MPAHAAAGGGLTGRPWGLSSNRGMRSGRAQAGALPSWARWPGHGRAVRRRALRRSRGGRGGRSAGLPRLTEFLVLRTAVPPWGPTAPEARRGVGGRLAASGRLRRRRPVARERRTGQGRPAASAATRTARNMPQMQMGGCCSCSGEGRQRS